MLARLSDSLLDSCRCDPAAPFASDSARDFGLHKDESLSRFEALKHYLDEQQQLLWANRRHALLLWLQGPDCSGKDGVIRHLFRGLNPQGVDVSNFQLPSHTEREEDFLARYRRRLPAAGSIGFSIAARMKAWSATCATALSSRHKAPSACSKLPTLKTSWPPTIFT